MKTREDLINKASSIKKKYDALANNMETAVLNTTDWILKIIDERIDSGQVAFSFFRDNGCKLSYRTNSGGVNKPATYIAECKITDTFFQLIVNTLNEIKVNGESIFIAAIKEDPYSRKYLYVVIK